VVPGDGHKPDLRRREPGRQARAVRGLRRLQQGSDDLLYPAGRRALHDRRVATVVPDGDVEPLGAFEVDPDGRVPERAAGTVGGREVNSRRPRVVPFREDFE